MADQDLSRSRFSLNKPDAKNLIHFKKVGQRSRFNEEPTSPMQRPVNNTLRADQLERISHISGSQRRAGLEDFASRKSRASEVKSFASQAASRVIKNEFENEASSVRSSLSKRNLRLL